MTRVELIAEVSTNHGGDLGLAKAFIWECAQAGADWVKFQSYQVRTLRPGDPQTDWFRQAELSDDAHGILIEECQKAGTKFLTTVFHHSRVGFLRGLGLEAVKIGSGETNERSLIDTICTARFQRVIVSEGIRPIQYWPESTIVPELLQCVSRYPASLLACVTAIERMRTRGVGYSDHSIGLAMCRRAIEAGARIIEKHVQLPKQKRTPRPYEATIAQLREIRQFADESPERFLGRWQRG